jgi:SAM-dependent methyltransferase
MTNVDDNRNLVQWVYGARNNRELEERYNSWAKSYDEDLDKDFGWLGPALALEACEQYVSTDARILDAGAGTGLVGKALSDAGYRNLTAIDMSPGMLEEARSKGVYRKLRRMVLGERLDFPDDSFDAVVSIGVLTVGHAPAHSLGEMVRVTRPGGHVIFTLRPDLYETAGFRKVREELEAAGRWELVRLGEPLQALPKGEPEVFHQLWVFKATSP